MPEYEKDPLWQAFAQTGKVEDYLRYRGVMSASKEEVPYGRNSDCHGPDYPGKQSYR